MFLTKKHLPRRTFLRGAGMMLGLPLLDSMIPAATAFAQTVAAKRPQLIRAFHARRVTLPERRHAGITRVG